MNRFVLLAFAAAFVMVAMLPSLRGMSNDAATRPVVSPSGDRAVQPAGNGFAGVTLTRAADGHFYADAQVNSATVRFLIDSGASAVVLTRADAQRAGIAAGDGDFSATAAGAGGMVQLKPVMLDRVAIGPVVATQVRGAVARQHLPVSLLGQSFLSRLSKLEIAENEMRLR